MGVAADVDDDDDGGGGDDTAVLAVGMTRVFSFFRDFLSAATMATFELVAGVGRANDDDDDVDDEDDDDEEEGIADVAIHGT